MPRLNDFIRTSLGALNSRHWNKRLIGGVFVLLLVDIIWVVSAELTEFIFHQSDFNKPFFTTYLKATMFSLYLVGFLFVKRWQYQINHFWKGIKVSEGLLHEIEHLIASQYPHPPYDDQGSSRCSSPLDTDEPFTFPTFETMTDDDASLVDTEQVTERKVTFSRVREVRSLSHSQYTESQILARMSASKVEKLRNILLEVFKKISLVETAKLALMFSVLWLIATLMYQEALSQTSASVTNIISSTSGIFTLLAAAIFPSSPVDKFSVSKFIATLVSFGGVFLICWSDPSRGKMSFNFGELYALLGSLFYTFYLILVRRKAGDDSKLDIPLFLGFVGLFSLLFFWPLFFILHYTKIEIFELPSHKMTWAYLIINGVVGTAVSELLWLWGCFLTSSLMATLALGLVIPLSMIWDILINHIKFSSLFFAGVVPVILAFIAVTILTHYGDWDPVKDLFCCCCRQNVCEVNEDQSQLLGQENLVYPDVAER